MILGSICGRGGSQGVPRKNIRLLNGRPLMAHAIECAQASKKLDRIVVSTDDEEFAGVARQYGAEVPFMRPAELATSDASKWDVFRHMIEKLEEQDGTRVDVLVDLDTGTPLRLPRDIDATIDALLKSDIDCVCTAFESDRNPYFNMVEENADGLYKVVTPMQPPCVCRQHAPVVYSLSPAVYALRRDAIFEFDHWSQSRMTIHPIPRERGIDIDSELDFALVEFLMKRES